MACIASVTVMTAAPLSGRGQAPPPNPYMMDPHSGGGVMGPSDGYSDGGCYDGGCYCEGGCYDDGGGCYDDGGGYGDPYGYGGPMRHHRFGGPRPGFTGPMPMGYGGTNPPIGYDLMNDVGVEGYLIDQRGPHYWDFRAEAVYLTRDETFGRNVIFTTEGAGATPENIRLFSDQLDYNYEPGFRIMGRCDICPLAVVEFGYTAVFDFEDEQSFTDITGAPTLFSLFSEFGANPPEVTDPTPGVNPMPQTEQAVTHSISIESDLQTAEISYRRYWLGWSPRISGTLLAGFRYTKLDEEFEFFSQGSQPPLNTQLGDAGLTYTVDADNDLSGFQAGADIWVGLAQGLRIGAEGKAGLYANRYQLTSQVVTFPNTVTPPTFFEEFKDTEPALIAEASADVVADILPSISLRAGYEILFINSLVLAGDNFNTGSPYNPGPVDNGFGPIRTPFLDDDGEALYHGGHAGFEFIW
jgi:hypothetical protein